MTNAQGWDEKSVSAHKRARPPSCRKMSSLFALLRVKLPHTWAIPHRFVFHAFLHRRDLPSLGFQTSWQAGHRVPVGGRRAPPTFHTEGGVSSQLLFSAGTVFYCHLPVPRIISLSWQKKNDHHITVRKQLQEPLMLLLLLIELRRGKKELYQKRRNKIICSILLNLHLQK